MTSSGLTHVTMGQETRIDKCFEFLRADANTIAKARSFDQFSSMLKKFLEFEPRTPDASKPSESDESV